MQKIRQAMGYASLSDFYEINKDLGQGKFGLVKQATHKKTDKKVAIKVIKKSEMNTEDYELVQREIEILKLCQHPHIIRLLDLFENYEYIYIVMEILLGGDLFTYLEERNFKITEERACYIVHALATALFYLHSYGIAHRDLKPENILMTSNKDDAEPKIVDFGLAKMVGPSEKCTEPFGTLSYVAPEVLMQKPYDKSVDVWSLGVVAYLLLCGTLPFDDDEEREIIRQTIYDEADFTHRGWKGVSVEAIDFVSKILDKDRSKRLTLNKVLEHPWIIKTNKGIGNIRASSKKEDMFKNYTNQEPKSK